MEQIPGLLLVLLVLYAPSGLAWLIVRWLSRQDATGGEARGHEPALKRSGL